MDANLIEGLKSAIELCRERESMWRKLVDQGGSDVFPEEHSYLRALEAMTIADIIEAAINS